MNINDLKQYLYELQMDPELAALPFLHHEVFSVGDNEFVIFEKLEVVNKILKCLYDYREQTRQELLKLKKNKSAISFYRNVEDEE